MAFFILATVEQEKIILSKIYLKNLTILKLAITTSFEIGSNKKAISEIFENDYVIIRNLEELSNEKQQMLTVALSTFDG